MNNKLLTNLAMGVAISVVTQTVIVMGIKGVNKMKLNKIAKKLKQEEA